MGNMTRMNPEAAVETHEYLGVASGFIRLITFLRHWGKVWRKPLFLPKFLGLSFLGL
jgi:hypothetical protein